MTPPRLVVAFKVSVVACAGLVLAGALSFPGRPAAIAPAPGWTTLPDPFGKTTTATHIATFGTAGVAVAGLANTIAISTDGGAHWKLRTVPAGESPVTDIAFSDATHGWAAGAADVIETTDGGATWQVVPQTGVSDAVAAAPDASLVCALTPSSVFTATSLDPPTFATEAAGLTPFPTAPAAIVAGPGGFAAATGANGALIVRASDGSWTAQDSTQDDLTDPLALALAPSPVWGNGVPDLFAVSATTVQGSDDQGASFPALPTPPWASAAPSQLCAACMGAPSSQLLVGGPVGMLARYVLASGSWSSATGPLKGTIVSCAAGPGGVAYALTAGGRVERTLSYGAAPFALSASTSTLTAGGTVTLTCSAEVRAPGTLALQARTAGGVWKPLKSWTWSSNPPAVGPLVVRPLATTQYRLSFVYGGQIAATSAALNVGVRPRLTVSPTALRLAVGSVYRLSGRVYPAQPGHTVAIWTNRGGTWHRVALGGIIRLAGGTSYRTRLFGTPFKQTYSLQVRLAGNASFLPVVSATVRVRVS
jgi:hypothetical protein